MTINKPIKRKHVLLENVDKEETRCTFCGCYMKEIDISSECGFDWEYVCNNKKCKARNAL